MSVAALHCLGTPTAPAEGFPALDRIGVRLANGLGDLFASLGTALRVTATPAATSRFGDWRAGLPPSVAIARYRTSGLRGGVMLSIPLTLLAAMIDRYYGGSGCAGRATGSTLGAAELRFLDRLADDARTAIANGWKEAAQLDPQLLCLAFTPGDLPPVRADDAVVVQRFAVGPSEEIELVYPAAALAALPALRGSGVTEPAVEHDSDPVWRARLSDAVMQSRLRVRTVIARPTVPLERLMTLAPGDTIPVCLPAQIPVTVAGRLLAHGTIGEANGRAAVKIGKIEQGGAFND